MDIPLIPLTDDEADAIARALVRPEDAPAVVEWAQETIQSRALLRFVLAGAMRVRSDDGDLVFLPVLESAS